MFWNKWGKKTNMTYFTKSPVILLETMDGCRKLVLYEEYKKMREFIRNVPTVWLVAYQQNNQYKPMVRFLKTKTEGEFLGFFSVPLFRTRSEATAFLDYCKEYFAGSDTEAKAQDLEIIGVTLNKAKEMYRVTYQVMDADGINGMEPIRLNLVLVWPNVKQELGDYPIEIIDTNFSH